MKVVAITAANSNRPDSFSRRREHEAHDEPGPALVTVAPFQPRAPQSPHRDAPFLAQLIAVKAQLPQTRERRRAEPEEAIALYRAANAGAPALSGRTLSTDR